MNFEDQNSGSSTGAKLIEAVNSTSLIKSLFVVINFQCSLTGKEIFKVTFLNQSAIIDRAKNALLTTRVQVKTKRMTYTSELQKKILKNSGDAFAGSGILTFIIALGLILFQ